MQVISRNPFDLLGDDGETPKVSPAPKPTSSTPAASAPKAREVPGSKAPTNNANKGGDNATRGKSGYYSRGGPRNVLKGGKTEGEVNVVDPEEGYEGERRAPGKNERGQARPRGHGEGSGRGRATRTPRGRGGASAGGPPGYAGAGERRNDGRRSAHALPDTEKRVASGWGAEDGAAELTAEVEGAADATKETAEPQTPTGETVPAAETEAAEKKPEEEEDNTKSYEEYLAERQAAKDAKLGKLEGRTVEGTSEFVGSVFEKKEEEFFSGAKKEKAAAAKKEKERKEKVFLEVEGKFAPPSRGEGREGAAGRGGRGGRGGFRGDRGGSDRPRGGAPRGGRGGARNNASSAPVAVNDESAFPALGA